jgi:molybdate transport system substrate-binding protein
MIKTSLAAPVAIALSLAPIILTQATHAAEIKVISANGLRAVLADIAPAFQAATGHTLAVTITETGDIRQRILSGARYDVIALPQATADELAKLGHITASSMVPVIRVNFGMAVRSGGAPKPDMSSVEALKRSLLAATSILITDPATGGISGVHFMDVLERLGIADEMKGKLKPNRGGGYHAERVAKGEADLAIQAEHEIRCVPGVEFVPYPAEFQRTIVFMAGRGATPTDAAGLREAGDASANVLVQFLRGPEAVQAIKARCLQPG